MTNSRIIYEVPKLEKQIYLFKYFLNIDEKFKNSLYLEYPELKQQKLEDYVTTLYQSKKGELESIKNITQQSWDRVEKNILHEFSNILQKEWNIEIVPGGLSLLPFSTRDLREIRFDVYYKKDTGRILKTTTHEIFHFLYFDKWLELYPNTTLKNMDYPSSTWALSEIVLPIMLNSTKVVDILGIEFKNYSMFENDMFNGENIVDHLTKIYENNSLEDFFLEATQYIEDYYHSKNKIKEE